MLWDSSPSAGFTADGVRPWLPTGEHAGRDVATQRDDSTSTLRFCRDLLALRRAEFAGTIQDYQELSGPAGVWTYRTGNFVVAANFTGGKVRLPQAVGEPLLSTIPGAVRRAGARVLQPWEGVISRPGGRPG